MTGFGRAMDSNAGGRLTAEVRSVNGRFFKLSTKLPPRYGALEERIKALLLKAGIRRGSVDVGLFFSESGGEDGGFAIDGAMLGRYARQAKLLAKAQGLGEELSIQALLGLPGVVVRQDSVEDIGEIWKRCEKVLGKALEQMDKMRSEEGAALAADIRKHLAALRSIREVLEIGRAHV